jgi:hypothetical protein
MKALWILYFASFIDTLAVGIIIPMVPYLATDLGASTTIQGRMFFISSVLFHSYAGFVNHKSRTHLDLWRGSVLWWTIDGSIERPNRTQEGVDDFDVWLRNWLWNGEFAESDGGKNWLISAVGFRSNRLEFSAASLDSFCVE